MNFCTVVQTCSLVCNGRFRTAVNTRPRCWLRERDLLSQPHKGGYYFSLKHFSKESTIESWVVWSCFLFSLDPRDRGCVVPAWARHFSAKFLWYLQKCVYLADLVWYCIMEEFLILTVTQTVMNNSFTTVLRISSSTETFCICFSLFSLFVTFSIAITWYLATCSGTADSRACMVVSLGILMMLAAKAITDFCL